MRDKDKEKHISNFKKRQQDAPRREAAATKRMQELMRQFGTILRQAITNSLFVPLNLPNIGLLEEEAYSFLCRS